MTKYRQERLFLYKEPVPQPKPEAKTVDDWITAAIVALELARTPEGKIDDTRIDQALDALPKLVRTSFNALVHKRLKR